VRIKLCLVPDPSQIHESSSGYETARKSKSYRGKDAPPTLKLILAAGYPYSTMDCSDLVELSAEELISKKDSIEDEIRKQHELLEAVRTPHTLNTLA